MKPVKILCLICILSALVLFMSCSKSGNPVEMEVSDYANIPDSIGLDMTGNRSVIAVYDAVIDPDSKTFTVTPSERSSYFHYPLTQMYPNVVKIVAYGWAPNFWADIKLTHPLPGSGIDVFDPRVIAILPANPGVSFHYPIFNCRGNNSVVIEPDGYTKIFDNLGGAIPGNTNPFKAYFKGQPYRVWSSAGVTSETQRWDMNLAGFGGPMVFKLVVDISTKYPNAPQPIIDNAPEPVGFDVFVGDGLNQYGGSTEVNVTFLDWQGSSQIKCKVEAPDLFSSAIQLFYSHPGTNPNEYVFEGMISNSLLAPAGEYNILIAAWDIPTDIHIFYENKVYVSRIPDNPVEATPPQLVFTIRDVFIDGNYAYIASGEYGLYIYDISKPLYPMQVNSVDTPNDAINLFVSNGYAYIADSFSGLQIVDIDPPESALIVKTIGIAYRAFGVYVSNGYAYILAENSYSDYLAIIDIEPLESAQIINTVYLDIGAQDIYVLDGYAYVAIDNSSLEIIDIDPPESSYSVKTIQIRENARCVHVSNGFAFVIADSCLQIIDIEPLESAYIVKTIETLDPAYSIHVKDGYAYVGTMSNLLVIDVTIPNQAQIVKSIGTRGRVRNLHVSGDYAYAAISGGVLIVDIKQPDQAYVASAIETTRNAYDVNVIEDYYYVANYVYGLQIISETFESAHIIKSVYPGGIWMDTGCVGRKVDVADGYAYLISDFGLHIVDVEPPESASIVKTVIVPGIAYGVNVPGDYAYVADKYYGLHIINIDPPKLAYILKTVNTQDYAQDVYVSDDYAYVADFNSGLQIIDVEPAESAYIFKTIDTPGEARAVYVTNGYAYVADDDGGTHIIDIEPLESSYIVNTVNRYNDHVGDIYVSKGYAYITARSSHCQIIDIDPPESAYIFRTIGMLCNGVYVSDQYAYFACVDCGLRIFKLW